MKNLPFNRYPTKKEIRAYFDYKMYNQYIPENNKIKSISTYNKKYLIFEVDFKNHFFTPGFTRVQSVFKNKVVLTVNLENDIKNIISEIEFFQRNLKDAEKMNFPPIFLNK